MTTTHTEFDNFQILVLLYLVLNDRIERADLDENRFWMFEQLLVDAVGIKKINSIVQQIALPTKPLTQSQMIRKLGRKVYAKEIKQHERYDSDCTLKDPEFRKQMRAEYLRKLEVFEKRGSLKGLTRENKEAHEANLRRDTIIEGLND